MSSADKHDGDVGPTAPESWLSSVVGLTGPYETAMISGGWSNINYRVTDAQGRQVVVRRPPDGPVGGGAHDVLREARIVAALHGSAVPVPVVVGQCDDLSVAGHPFYVMDYLPDPVVASAGIARGVPAANRPALGFALVDVLAELQAVDIDAVGLGSLRRSTPYVPRQLRRWTEQWRATATRAVPAVDRVAERLERALGQVAPSSDVLVHGDFRFGNVMIGGPDRPSIVAVLDWELTTTGHPLADLGFLGVRMLAPSGVLEDLDPSAVEGYPSFADLVARYESRTGTSTRDVPVFAALSAWRWAIIVEGIQQRISRGVMAGGMGGGSAEDPAWHRERVELLAGFAADLLA